MPYYPRNILYNVPNLIHCIYWKPHHKQTTHLRKIDNSIPTNKDFWNVQFHLCLFWNQLNLLKTKRQLNAAFTKIKHISFLVALPSAKRFPSITTQNRIWKKSIMILIFATLVFWLSNRKTTPASVSTSKPNFNWISYVTQ